MDLGIKGRVAMVAAASKGLGRAIAESLAAEGCAVSLCARDEARLHTLAAELRDRGASVLTTRCDVSQAQDLDRWVAATHAALGPADILITNTGGPPAARFLDLTEDQWRAGIDSTLMNVVRLCRSVAPEMRRRRWGRIVHVTSLVAKQPLPTLTISSTLRAGLSALTKSLATELAPDNVLVNAILPGHVRTERQDHLNQLRAKEEGTSMEAVEARVQHSIPLQRFGTPREIGDVVAFLCSERASYLTGVSLQVDGGLISSTF